MSENNSIFIHPECDRYCRKPRNNALKRLHGVRIGRGRLQIYSNIARGGVLDAPLIKQQCQLYNGRREQRSPAEITQDCCSVPLVLRVPLMRSE